MDAHGDKERQTLRNPFCFKLISPASANWATNFRRILEKEKEAKWEPRGREGQERNWKIEGDNQLQHHHILPCEDKMTRAWSLSRWSFSFRLLFFLLFGLSIRLESLWRQNVCSNQIFTALATRQFMIELWSSHAVSELALGRLQTRSNTNVCKEGNATTPTTRKKRDTVQKPNRGWMERRETSDRANKETSRKNCRKRREKSMQYWGSQGRFRLGWVSLQPNGSWDDHEWFCVRESVLCLEEKEQCLHLREGEWKQEPRRWGVKGVRNVTHTNSNA